MFEPNHRSPLRAARCELQRRRHDGARANAPSAAASSSRPSPRFEETYVDERGNTATRLVPAAKVVPGDEVDLDDRREQRLHDAGRRRRDHESRAASTCATSATRRSAPAPNIEFSLDGSTFAAPEALVVAEADGSRRPARADEYSAIRWVLPRPMGPSESLIVRYRATVL